MNKVKNKNFGFKIFSLLLATVSWIYMHGVVQKISGGPVAYKDMHQVEILLMGEQMVIGERLVT